MVALVRDAHLGTPLEEPKHCTSTFCENRVRSRGIVKTGGFTCPVGKKL